MFVEVNKLIARFGVDPRDFTLMPFGGAGPMLGCFLARELGIGAIMVPRRPGVVCALGGLIADVIAVIGSLDVIMGDVDR